MSIQESVIMAVETQRAETRLAKEDVKKIEKRRGKKIGAILRDLVIADLIANEETPESTEVKHGDASRISKKP